MKEMTIDTLFLHYLHGEADDAMKDEVRRLLEEDPKRIGTLWRLAEEEEFLREDLPQVVTNGFAAPAAERPRRPVRVRRPVRGFGWGRWVAVAACLLIAAGAVLYNIRESQPGRQVGGITARIVAHVQSASSGITIHRGESGIVAAVGVDLRVGDRIEVGRGGRRLTFSYDGEKTGISTKGPTILTVGDTADGKRLKLETGKIAVDAAPQPAGEPLVVETKYARVTVVGTTFSLSTGTASTKVQVFDGLVDFMSMADGRSLRVGKGQFAVVGDGIPLAMGYIGFEGAEMVSLTKYDIEEWKATWEPSLKDTNRYFSVCDAPKGVALTLDCRPNGMRAVPRLTIRSKTPVEADVFTLTWTHYRTQRLNKNNRNARPTWRYYGMRRDYERISKDASGRTAWKIKEYKLRDGQYGLVREDEVRFGDKAYITFTTDDGLSIANVAVWEGRERDEPFFEKRSIRR
jgi:hypothetical protein